MKKGLLSIAAGLLISLGASAQYDADLWLVDDQTTNVLSITGITEANGFDGEVSGPTITTGYGDTYAYSWVGDALKIDFTNTQSPNQWADFGFTLIQWEGNTGVEFMKDSVKADQDHDVARGWTVDFTDEANREVTFKVQADAELELRADLGDIAGKVSNNASPAVTVAATVGGVDVTDAAKWTTLTYSWGDNGEADASVAVMEDAYSGAWWDISYSTFTWKDAINPLSPTQIARFMLTIDQGATGAVDDAKTLYVKDLQIGAAANPTIYEPFVNITTVEGGVLEVVDGVVYSEGTITVTGITGQVVLTAEGSLSISALPAGAYVITAAEGSAKIVK